MVFAELHIVPTITNKSKSKVTIFEGNVLYLVCEAKGYPTPSVTWKKNDKVLQTSINKTDFITDDTSEKDAGKYECEVSNSVGTVSYTVEVAIKGKENWNSREVLSHKSPFAENDHMVQNPISWRASSLCIIPALGRLNKETSTSQVLPAIVLVSRCENNHELALQHGGFCTMGSFVAKSLFSK